MGVCASRVGLGLGHAGGWWAGVCQGGDGWGDGKVLVTRLVFGHARLPDFLRGRKAPGNAG